MKSPLLQFFISFFVVLIVTLLVVWGLKGPLAEYVDLSSFNEIGSIITATLGIAVGLAGAFVAIKIASLANDIIQHERERDDFSFINDKIESGLNPIINVARKMSLLYAAQISGKAESSKAIDEVTSDENWREKDLGRECGFELHYKKSLAEATQGLADALEVVLLNSYSMFIWRQTGEDEKERLGGVAIGDVGISLSVANDLGEIIGLLRMRAKGLEMQSVNATLADVLAPRMAANVAKDSNGENFDNSSIRSLLELGAEIWSLQQGGSVTNVGAAILLDISRCIPNSAQELKDTISKLFGGVIESEFLDTSPILSVTEKLGTQFWFGSSLSYALTESEKIGVTLSV